MNSSTKKRLGVNRPGVPSDLKKLNQIVCRKRLRFSFMGLLLENLLVFIESFLENRIFFVKLFSIVNSTRKWLINFNICIMFVQYLSDSSCSRKILE